MKNFGGQKVNPNSPALSFEEIRGILKEAPLKVSIGSFKKTCQSKIRKDELNFSLRGYETYLITKPSLFKESQRTSLNWIRDRVYTDPAVFKVTD